MDLKLLLSVTFIGILIYFRFGPGVRLLKKKSHHYIEPPDPESDPNWVPIEMDDYHKYILSHRVSSEDTTDDVYEAIKDEFPRMKFEVSIKKDWFLISIEEVNFEDFHNAISFCTLIAENVIGFCQHKQDDDQDYIVKSDLDADLDFLIGAFRNGDNFGIYLPKSKLDVKGNISKSNVNEISFKQEFKKIQDLIN
jgi:hypothetical protein